MLFGGVFGCAERCCDAVFAVAVGQGLAGEFKLAEGVGLDAPRAEPVVQIEVQAFRILGAEQLARVDVAVLPGAGRSGD